MRRLASALAVMAMMTVAACSGSDKTTGPNQNAVAGTWKLQTVNGSALPFTIVQVGNDKIEITDDVITATSTGSFTQITTFRTTQNGQTTTDTQPDAGSYVVNGSAITFTFNSDGSTGTGTINGNTITVAESGLSAVYKKQ